MVRWWEVPGRTRRGVYRRLAAHDPYDSAGETVEKGGKQGIKEEGQEQSATAADRREETTGLRFHPGGKAARHPAAIRAISACAVAIAYSLGRSTGSRNFFTLTSATECVGGCTSQQRGERSLAACCARRERPRGSRATEKRDEVAAAHYSITSSARASKVGGTSRPSAIRID